jgi:ferrous iron transport protein A
MKRQTIADTALQPLVDYHILGRGRRCFVINRVKVVGLLTLHHIKEVPCSEWPTTTAAQVMVSAPQTRGGRHFLSRLAALGFTPGARLRVMQNFGHSPIIVNLRDTRVALGRGEATKILVERLVGGEDGCRS